MPGHYGSHHSGGKKKTEADNRPNPHTDSGSSRATSVSKGALARNKSAMEKAAKERDRDKLSNYQVKRFLSWSHIIYIKCGSNIKTKRF